MTSDEIEALSDAELTKSVAEQVMRWIVSPSNQTIWYGHLSPITPWRPLDDWNHAMMAVEEMRAKGFCSIIFTGIEEWEIQFWPTAKLDMMVRFGASHTDPTAQRRAILQAALMAIKETT